MSSSLSADGCRWMTDKKEEEDSVMQWTCHDRLLWDCACGSCYWLRHVDCICALQGRWTWNHRPTRGKDKVWIVIVYLSALTYTRTEFLLISLRKQLAKIHSIDSVQWTVPNISCLLSSFYCCCIRKIWCSCSYLESKQPVPTLLPNSITATFFAVGFLSLK